jgi:hypothetical protein
MIVLRIVLLVLGLALIAGALLLCLEPGPRPGVFGMLAGGVVLTVGMLFERRRYKPALERMPGAGWIATGERFVDPETGRNVTVFHKPATGERQYIADPT